jgi:hypothetical protein
MRRVVAVFLLFIVALAGSPPALAQGSPPLPPEAVERAEWEYAAADRKVGPFTLTQMKQFLVAGTIGPDTFVWRPGLATWQRVRDVAELRDFARGGTGFGGEGVPALRERFKAHMVGTWRMRQTVTNAAGTMQVETVITFARDGSHAGTESRFFSGMVSTAPRQGNWDVTPQSDTSFALTITEEGGSAHVILRVIDRDTLFNESARVNVSRVR